MTRYTPFKLAYGQDVVILIEYIVPSLRVATLLEMANEETLNERLLHLVWLEEDCFITRFHQYVQKEREIGWHDRHFKYKALKEGDLVLLYDSKFAKFPSKFCMHWLGPYLVKHVTNSGVVQLVKLNDEVLGPYQVKHVTNGGVDQLVKMNDEVFQIW